MSGVLVMYDSGEGKNHQFKDKMLKKGYLDYLSKKDDKIELPDTTLYHPTKDHKEGYQDLLDVAKDIGVTLDDAISMDVGNLSGKIKSDPSKKMNRAIF